MLEGRAVYVVLMGRVSVPISETVLLIIFNRNSKIYKWKHFYWEISCIKIQYVGTKRETNVIIRDAPIDRPGIGIGRFLAWPAPIGDRLVILTSCRFRAFYCQRHRQRRHSHAHTHSMISQSHVSTSFSSENDSNFNDIQCKQRLIMYLRRARYSVSPNNNISTIAMWHWFYTVVFQ